MTQSTITFGPYRLDRNGRQLYKGDEPVALQPRPLAVLCYLAARPGTVVGRDELIEKLWAGTAVTKAVLKVAVRAIREALEDDAEAPRYIETVGREGYRLIGDASGDPAAGAEEALRATASVMVGRHTELAALQRAFDRAHAGARQIVFLTGEAGIGKSALIDRFVTALQETSDAWVARGQCLEQYGEGEPYLPVLEAIASLSRGSGAATLPAVLERYAPTWLAQLPALGAEAPPPPAAEASAAMPARMLREMADALEVLTQSQTVVLVLEDLHWSDRSTADLLSCLARRRHAARLLIVGSLRSGEAAVREPALRAVKQELLAGGLCSEIALELLSLAEVAAYIGARFGAGSTESMQRLASRIHERSDGNALFMVNVANDLIAQQIVVWRGGAWCIDGSIEHASDRIPNGLRELIGRRMDGLAPEARRALDVASVVGDDFSSAAVAAALEADAPAVDEICEALAAQGAVIGEAGLAERDDGSLTGRYRFLHALYRRVLYDAIGQSRRAHLHRAIGLGEEAALGERASEHAAELAMHFALGHDHARAVKYYALAGKAALERHAAHEAVAHFTAALAALEHLPQSPERAERELRLVVAKATLLMAVRGYAAPETEQEFARARALCDASRPSTSLYRVLRGLVSYHHVRAEMGQARELGEQLLSHAERDRKDLALRIQAHYGHGATLFHIGALEAAREHFEAALAEYDPAMHREHVLGYGGYDPGVASSLWLAWTLAFLGRLDEARARNREGLEIAQRGTDSFSLAWAHQAAAVTYQLFGDWPASEAAAAEAVRLADELGFPHVLGMARVNRGWAVLMQGDVTRGAALLRDGVAAVDATGARLVRPAYLGMMAAVDAFEGHGESAATKLDAALAEIERTGERLHEAALLTAKGHLLAGRGAVERPSSSGLEGAAVYFRYGLEVARAQGARLFELRAAVALARLRGEDRRRDEGREVLAAALDSFATVRLATPELSAARQLLVELGGTPGESARRAARAGRSASSAAAAAPPRRRRT